MNNPTIINNVTGLSWKYSGPFYDRNEMYVLDYFGKIIRFYDNISSIQSSENTHFSVKFDQTQEILESWMPYEYKEIAHLFDRSISDIHLTLKKNIKWQDGRIQIGLKSLKIQIDQVREKVKSNQQLTSVEQKIYDLVLSRYMKKTQSGKTYMKSLPEAVREIIYNDYSIYKQI